MNHVFTSNKCEYMLPTLATVGRGVSARVLVPIHDPIIGRKKCKKKKRITNRDITGDICLTEMYTCPAMFMPLSFSKRYVQCVWKL